VTNQTGTSYGADVAYTVPKLGVLGNGSGKVLGNGSGKVNIYK
jgi:hypothetical protein